MSKQPTQKGTSPVKDGTRWLWVMSTEDIQLVEAEIKFLVKSMPGVGITRHDAVRSLIRKGSKHA